MSEYVKSETEMKTLRGRAKSIGLGVFYVVLLVGVVALWLDYPSRVAPLPPDQRGVHGDQFGGLTALFTGLAFALLVITLGLQMRELHYQREEMIGSRKEMEKQRKTLEEQRADTLLGALISINTARARHHDSIADSHSAHLFTGPPSECDKARTEFGNHSSRAGEILSGLGQWEDIIRSRLVDLDVLTPDQCPDWDR